MQIIFLVDYLTGVHPILQALLGAAFAAEFGQKVLLVDANYSAPNLGLHLGIVEPDHSIHDVLNDKVPVQEAIIHHQFGFDVLAAYKYS
ncbi:MAG: hypothetical protein HYT75_04070 [Deltaproteobacteria bacterium]|nr:hypothetical protein [Deltaproteobacteria bacterium]